MLPRSLTTALLSATIAVALVACASAEQAAPPAELPAAPVEGAQPDLEIVVDGPTWSATFPGVAVQRQQPFPVEGVGELTADQTYWDSSTEAVLIQVVTLPESQGDAAAQLLTTAANLGTVVADSPLLDDDGTFRGLPAVVVAAEDGGTLLNLLAFVDNTTLYQLMHIKSSADEPDRLAALASSFELR